MPQPEKALVDNASDREQIRQGTKREKHNLQQEANELRAVESDSRACPHCGMSVPTPEGRSLLLRFLERCSTFMSIWHDNPAVLAFNSGQQDVGHWLMSEMAKVDPMMLMRLMELKAKRAKE
jgi:hypothetical protein